MRGRIGGGAGVNGVAAAVVILMVDLALLAVLVYYEKYVELFYERGEQFS